MSDSIIRLFRALDAIGLFHRKKDFRGYVSAWSDDGAAVFVKNLDNVTIHLQSEQAIIDLVEALERQA